MYRHSISTPHFCPLQLMANLVFLFGRFTSLLSSYAAVPDIIVLIKAALNHLYALSPVIKLAPVGHQLSWAPLWSKVAIWAECTLGFKLRCNWANIPEIKTAEWYLQFCSFIVLYRQQTLFLLSVRVSAAGSLMDFMNGAYCAVRCLQSVNISR